MGFFKERFLIVLLITSAIVHLYFSIKFHLILFSSINCKTETTDFIIYDHRTWSMWDGRRCPGLSS